MRYTWPVILASAVIAFMGCSSSPTDPTEPTIAPAPPVQSAASKPTKYVHDATTSGYLGGNAGSDSPGSWCVRHEGPSLCGPLARCTWGSTDQNCINMMLAMLGKAGMAGVVCTYAVAKFFSYSLWSACAGAGYASTDATSTWRNMPPNPGPTTAWSNGGIDPYTQARRDALMGTAGKVYGR